MSSKAEVYPPTLPTTLLSVRKVRPKPAKFRPDMFLSIDRDTIHNIELTIGFETNIHLNAERKHGTYLQHTHDLSSMYRCVRLINLSISFLKVFGNSCKSFIEMCKDLDFEA